LSSSHAASERIAKGRGIQVAERLSGRPTRVRALRACPVPGGFLQAKETMGVPLHGDLSTVLAGTALLVLAYEGIGLVLAAWFANLRFATSAAAFVATPAFALVGLTFPTKPCRLGRVLGDATYWGRT